jgi:hypothetical protein
MRYSTLDQEVPALRGNEKRKRQTNSLKTRARKIVKPEC